MAKKIIIKTSTPKQRRLLVSAKNNLSMAVGDLSNLIFEGCTTGDVLELQRNLQSIYNSIQL